MSNKKEMFSYPLRLRDLQNTPKILLPDNSGNSLLFIDEGRFYPLHNIYYITGEDIHQLKILCSILMSDFVRKQIQRLSNNMNGGYARWQSQNLRKHFTDFDIFILKYFEDFAKSLIFV